jgi:hypothetical protein
MITGWIGVTKPSATFTHVPAVQIANEGAAIEVHSY